MDEKIQKNPDEPQKDPTQKHAREPALHKRKTGAGERIFNFGVYGGISWILNEITSTALTSTIYESQVKPGASFISKVFTPNGLAHKPFEAAVDWLHAHANPKKWGRTPFFLAAEMVVMTTGGHLMVLLSKPAEDHKGKIVRAIDNVLTGGRGEENPGVKRAHEEMDAAPKQSWFSQAWGRVLVVVTAIAQHFSMGAESEHYVAPTTRWLKGTVLEKYSNLKRVMTTGTRDIMSLKYMPGATAEQKAVMKLNRAGSLGADGKFLWMQPEEGKIAMAMGNTFGYVLIVSATMATLFFITSHIIAAFRDKGKDKREERVEEKLRGEEARIEQRLEKVEQERKEPAAAAKDERPDAKVAQVENHLTVRPSEAAQAVQHG